METQKKIIALLGKVAKITKGDTDAETFKLMAQVLQKHGYEAVENAAVKGLEKWTFFPTVAEIVEILKPSHKVQANDSFQRALEHVKRFGSQKAMNGLTRVEQVALKSIGGLSGIGMCTSDEVKWKRKEYLDLYESYADTPGYEDDSKQITDGQAKKFLNKLDVQIGT